jgi:transcriptional regulator with XRE-family HTH domain
MLNFQPDSFWKWGQKSELARRAGISRQYLADILNCRKRALPELAQKLEDASREMDIHIDRDYFMYPAEASPYIFNTAEVKKQKKLKYKKKLEDSSLFEKQCLELTHQLSTGRGRLPSRKQPSKRTLRMLDYIANKAVESIESEKALKAMCQREAVFQAAIAAGSSPGPAAARTIRINI